MFQWGKGGISPATTEPTFVDNFSNRSVLKVSIHESIIAVLLEDGSVYTKIIQDGQLSEYHKVTALETISVIDVCAGHSFIMAIDVNLRVYGWGKNSSGQIGLYDYDYYQSPKPIKTLQSQIVSVACGEAHSLFLSSVGDIFSCGSNEYGQLGTGPVRSHKNEVKKISSLSGIPFSQIAAGYWHSLAVTKSGAVFGWGRNDEGQLGVGDFENRNTPVLLKSLRSQPVKFVAAGAFHTAALTSDGGLFTFGSNKQGQLGHGKSFTSVNPKKVFELMGNEVTQVCCGSSHTLTYLRNSGQILSFGDNEFGQLGVIGNNVKQGIPHLVSGPWSAYSAMQGTSFANSKFVQEIAAGDESSAAIQSQDVDKPPSDFRERPTKRSIFTLNPELIAKLEALSNEDRIMPDVEKYLQTVMSSASSLNASFLAGDHQKTSATFSGVSLMAVRLGFSKLCGSDCKRVQEVMKNSLQKLLIPSLTDSPPDIEALRIFLILPECQLLQKVDCYPYLTLPFAMKCSSLTAGASKVLDKWYRSMEPLYFVRPVDMGKDCIMQILRRPTLDGFDMQAQMIHILNYMRKLNNANDQGDKRVIPYQQFYIPGITDLVNLEDDYIKWIKGHSGRICSYPFLLNSQAKTSLLQIDAVWQMRSAYSEAQDRNMASLFGFGGNQILETPVLQIEVRRQELVHDALTTLANVDMRSLKKPLVVEFRGEEGQDAGGVRKEFFMLILREVIDPKYGMFQYFDESRLMWLSDFELETDMMYFLVGLLCGLAIYNNTIIDICFPLAMYKKLLGEKPTLFDLKELDPTTSRSLRQLLEYEGNVEEVFCLDFTVARNRFGETRTVELMPGGADIAVTEQNRQEYVNAYVDFIFNTSVRSQYEAFSKGFHKVCGGQIMNLFRPMELMEMVVGNQNYNWEEFEKTAQYKGEFYRQHAVISMFWNVFHKFSLEEKKDFLLFLTGCNKVPINGVKITIQPVRVGNDYLPVAHTCFNLLDLPLYSSQNILESKLKLAMQNNQGFHLV